MANCVLCGSESESSRTVFPMCPECSAKSNQDSSAVPTVVLRESQSQNWLDDTPEQEPQSWKGTTGILGHLPSFMSSTRGSRTKTDFAISSLLWLFERRDRGSAQRSSSATGSQTDQEVDKKGQKDNGAVHVLGGVLIILGGVWSISQGGADDNGIMIIIGGGLIMFGIAMSLFGLVRFLLTQSRDK
jgi:hypothetical protein